jgi:hypothetical protein
MLKYILLSSTIDKYFFNYFQENHEIIGCITKLVSFY